MTAVRVSELDGMLTPQPLTLRASCLKAPPGAFVFMVERMQLTRVIDDEVRRPAGSKP
jgi:hypothetical protein